MFEVLPTARRCHPTTACGVTWLMKTPITSLCLALFLALGASAPAFADHRYDGGYRDGYYEPPRHRHHHEGRYRDDYRAERWVAPAAIVALTGIAAGVAASAYYAPRPVYVAPPQPVYVPPRPVYVVPARPVYAVPAQPVYAAPAVGYWGY